METFNFIRKYALKNLQNFNPHVKVKSIADINFEKIRKFGFTKIIFDKDNTLTKTN